MDKCNFQFRSKRDGKIYCSIKNLDYPWNECDGIENCMFHKNPTKR